MVSEMIERVAKGIFDAMDIADGLDGTVAEKYARAAIAAMREPTAEMSWGGGTAMHDEEEDSTGVWRRMIDAALADPLPVYDRLTDDALGSREVEQK